MTYKAQTREEALADAKKKARQISTGLFLALGKAYAVEELNTEN
jgi:hypothetical protein